MKPKHFRVEGMKMSCAGCNQLVPYDTRGACDACLAKPGYWMVHSCGDLGCEEFCDAVFVWTDSAEKALELVGRSTQEPSVAEAERRVCLDPYRAELGDVASPNFGGDKKDAAWRKAGFREEGAATCSTCDLPEWDSIPESRVCTECSECYECEPVHGNCEVDDD